MHNAGYTGHANGGNNGQITSITDSTDTAKAGRSVSYTYDVWARLKTAQTTGTTQFPQWGLRWDYDRFGNRLAQVVTAGAGVPPNAVTINPATNRITDPGYSYDLSGNMTNDGQNTMTYDGENRVATSAQGGTTTSYAYDGKGIRVKKQVGAGTATVYVFSGSKVIAEYAAGGAAGSPLREYIYSGSQLLATIEGTSTKYHHADHLSARFTTDASGGSIFEQGHYPFGENWYTTGTASKWKFTTYERDGGTGESSNDYAMARYYVNRLGRFSGPDPIAGSVLSPQSLNRFSYVRNNPINLTDPSGLYPGDQHEFFTFILAVLAGRPDANEIASGAGAADNFWNATTGLLGLGYFINFNKHFGTPCPETKIGCTSGGWKLGFQLHLVQDNSRSSPHRCGSSAVNCSLQHIGLSMAGRSPDRDPDRRGGWAETWRILLERGTNVLGLDEATILSAVGQAMDFINANGLRIVGSSVTIDGVTTTHGSVDLTGATRVHTIELNGITIEIWQLPGGGRGTDPYVKLIQVANSLPGSNPSAEAEALYLCYVYGPCGK